VQCRAVELGLVSHWTSADDDAALQSNNSNGGSSSSDSNTDSGSGSGSAANVHSSKCTAASMTIDLHGMTVPLAHSVRTAYDSISCTVVSCGVHALSRMLV
jgi:hypothetical protein